jgi:hypothetical protein
VLSSPGTWQTKYPGHGERDSFIRWSYKVRSAYMINRNDSITLLPAVWASLQLGKGIASRRLPAALNTRCAGQ